MISAIVIIILFCISAYLVGIKQLGVVQPDNMKGYGERKESIQVLLDRIEWSNRHNERIDYNIRYMLYALVIAMFANIIYQTGEFSCLHILQCTIVVWIILVRMHTFFYFHADQFADNFIRKNIKYLRKKLKVASDINGLTTINRKFYSTADTV